jgi:exodeoxyribonuclease VII large subunit
MLLLTVSELNAHLREVLTSDPLLADVWVQAEVSNCRRAASGHYYFTLKDDSAALDAVMWRSHAARLSAPLNVGDAVLVHGAVSIYEVSGRLQLYADLVRPAGVGLLAARFEELKLRLEAEGLFDARRKRPLPALPRRIGVATSAQGAALQDILTVVQRRCPLVEVLLAPCLVQGEQAPASIVAALRLLYARDVDLIILARGGGSLEDLWSFNDEAVARAVAASPVPLLTGVGHETDTSIADLVADMRAPTPSAAAELAVPELDELQDAIDAARQRLDAVLALRLDTLRLTNSTAASALHQHQPATRINRARQQLDDLLRRASSSMGHSLALQRARLTGLDQQLAALSPQATLRRGYSLVQQADGRPLARAAQVQPGARLTITLHDGSLTVDVLTTHSDSEIPEERTEGSERSEGGLADD